MPRYYVEMDHQNGAGDLWDRQSSMWLARFKDMSIAERVARLLNAALEQTR